MSNYTKATNFTAKDSLNTGNVGKIVKGSEIDAELVAIATAVSSKADTASPAFTGTPSLPTGTTAITQTAGNSSVAVATTAFVNAERTNTATLTNKSIALGSNTVTGTTAQFNAALTDNNFTTLAGIETLTNKSLTSPTLTGSPTAPTQAAGDNSTKIATTQHVYAERSNTATLTNKTISGGSNTITNVSLTGSVTGTLPVANGGTGVTTKTGTGSVVLSASPALTGTPTAPTASNATDNTQIATTEFVKNILDNYVYPVGSIYTNATNSANPGTLLGFGTWEAFGAGRVAIGNGGGFTAGATGGSADAIVVSHTHTFSGTTDDPGNHSHNQYGPYGGGGNPGGSLNVDNPSGQTTATTAAGAHTHTVSGTIGSTGSSGTNANLQPYIVVYMWKRIS